MEPKEFDALVAKVGTETATKIQEAVSPIQKAFDAFEEKYKANPESVTKEDVEKIKGLVETKDADLRKILTTQGESITELEKKLNVQESGGESVAKVLEGLKDKIQAVYRNKTGAVEIQLGYVADKNGRYQLVAKAADVHNTTTTGANASITQNVSAAALLRGDANAPIETIQRKRPWILDFVFVGSTANSSFVWFNEVPKQGDFAVTAEGAVKPLLMYTFDRLSADYKKVAGRVKITEEFAMDFPRLVSTIEDLMRVDCRNKMNDLILTDLIANASTYSNPALALQIDGADNWAAIAAAAGQLANFYYTPNILVLNPNQGIINATMKDSTGQYINYEPLMREIEAGNITVLRHPDVAMGKFFLGDGNAYKVWLRGDLIVRIGYSNDDFDRNQYSMVVEQYFFAFISAAKKAGLIYGDFAAIKTAIEKP